MIVVTAPTGQIGQHVLAELLRAKLPLRLVVRNAAKLPAEVRGQADIVEGSHGDPVVIDRALDGADALFWLAPPDPSRTLEQVYLDFTRPCVDALKRHRVKRVVAITALGRGTPWQDRAGLVTASLGMDDLLMSSGVAFRGLAMPSFMDNILHQVGSIRDQGLMFGPVDPDKAMPTIATRDIGAAAARLLADERWTGQQEMPLLGPEDLSNADMAAIVSEVLGREVRYRQTLFDALKQQFLERGASDSFAEGYVEMYRAKNEGMDNVAKRDAASRTPTSFRQWCEDELKPAVTAAT